MEVPPDQGVKPFPLDRGDKKIRDVFTEEITHEINHMMPWQQAYKMKHDAHFHINKSEI
jgi:hypothetical protein